MLIINALDNGDLLLKKFKYLIHHCSSCDFEWITEHTNLDSALYKLWYCPQCAHEHKPVFSWKWEVNSSTYEEE